MILVIFVIFILFFTDAIGNILLVQAMLIKLLNQGKLLSILYPSRLTALVSSYNITLESLTKLTTKLLPTDLSKFHIARSRLFIARPVYCASAVV